MTSNCTAYLCPNIYKRGSVITFYRFPQDPELLEKWVQATEIKDLKVTPDSKLCSDHFKPEDFNRIMGAKVLTPMAVPSVFSSFPMYFTAAAKRKRPIEDDEESEEPREKRVKVVNNNKDAQVNRCQMYCRLCAEAAGNGVSIFSPQLSVVSFYESFINKYLTITVSREDRLSKKLCKDCADVLVKFNSLALKSVSAQNKLKQIGGFLKEAQVQVTSDNVEEPEIFAQVDDDFAANLVEEIVAETGNWTEELVTVAEINCEVEENFLEESAPIAPVPAVNADSDDSDSIPIVELLKKKKASKKKKPVKLAYRMKQVRKKPKAPQINPSDGTKPGDTVPPSWQDVLFCKDCDRFGTTPRPELKVKCVICGDVQPNLLLHCHHLKKEHKNNNDPENPNFKHHCNKCGQGFPLETTALKHEKICMRMDRNVCEICNKRFTSPEAHYRSHGTIDCKACSKTFFIPSQLRQHVRLEHKTSQFCCVDCGKEYSNAPNLKLHSQLHSVMDYICPFCGVGCTNVTRFSIHLVMHTKERPYKCSYCGKSFKHPRYIYIHERESHFKGKTTRCRDACTCQSCAKEKPFKCALCPKVCRQSGSLKVHIASCHGGHVNRTFSRRGDQNFKCEICGKGFLHQHSMEIHRKSHDFQDSVGGKEFGCLECGKKFKKYVGFYNHSITAHFPDVCGNQCKLCGKAFLVASALQNHIRAKHGEERTYDCEQCGKSFRIQASLTRHINAMHKKKEKLPILPCDQCGAIFHHKAQLRNHKATHV